MDLEVYKKSDFYEDYISSQKEYYERANADAYFAERLAEKDKELRHQKYKRCLAMVKWCKAEAEINHNSAYEASEYLPSREDYFRRRAEHYERWQKRWLELAEQFKDKEEAK